MSKLRKALEGARHSLVCLNGLVAHDGHPEQAFTIDTKPDIEKIDAALAEDLIPSDSSKFNG